MILLRMLGALDLLALFIMVVSAMGLLGWKPLFAAAFYLIAKGFYFHGDLNSYVDIICGAYLILMMMGVETWFTYVVILYMAQKIFFSFA